MLGRPYIGKSNVMYASLVKDFESLVWGGDKEELAELWLQVQVSANNLCRVLANGCMHGWKAVLSTDYT